ncbi:hypothetical protein [Bandra megavirus]|uniref:Uncharacterized protein n=1 Tax=Bandra megavirus TaxID=2071566 RepID=A0A2K9V8Q7_9VIRU|nr:hypothetical protein [Bandra megavirus]
MNRHYKDLNGEFDGEVLSEDFRNMCKTFTRQFSHPFPGERFLPNILNFDDVVSVNHSDIENGFGIKKIINGKGKKIHPFESYQNEQKKEKSHKIKIHSSKTKNIKKRDLNQETVIEIHDASYDTNNNTKINTPMEPIHVSIHEPMYIPIDNPINIPIDNPINIPIDNLINEPIQLDSQNTCDYWQYNSKSDIPDYQFTDILDDLSNSKCNDVYDDIPSIIPEKIIDGVSDNIPDDISIVLPDDMETINDQITCINNAYNTELQCPIKDIEIKSDARINILDLNIDTNNMNNDNNMNNNDNMNNNNNMNDNDTNQINNIEKTCNDINISKDNYNINKNYFYKDNMNKEYMNTDNNLEISKTNMANLEESRFDPLDKNFYWKDLTVEDINVSLKVVAELREGGKLKVVDNSYLAEDNAYLGSISRYTSGQGRDKIMSFLDHLFYETKRNHEKLITDIRNEKDVDNKIPELRDLFSNMIIFLHKYEIMRNVYKSDSGTHARLANIRNKFFTFKESFFKDLCAPKS